MARAKLSALITSLAGKYGGGVFRNWKGRTVLSALPSAVGNPATAAQERARSIISCSSKMWQDLAAARRAEWRAVAEYLSEQWENSENEIGERQVIYPPRGPYTGLGALCSVCGLLASVDDFDCGDAVPTAPAGVTAPSIPILGTMSGDTTVGITIPWTDPSSWGTNGSAGNVRVYIKSEDGTFHAQLAAFEADGTETTTVTELRPRGGGVAIGLTVGVYHVQLDAVNAEGLRSAPSAVGEIRIEAAV